MIPSFSMSQAALTRARICIYTHCTRSRRRARADQTSMLVAGAVPLHVSLLQAAHLDQFDRLLFVTLTPIAALVLLWLAYTRPVWLLRLPCRRVPFIDAQPGTAPVLESIRRRVVQLALVLVFVVYPGVATEVVKAFRCQDFDDGASLLRADLRISCTSPRFATMLVYALVMVAVYPVGIPATLFFVLWRHRRRLFPGNLGLWVRVAHAADGASPCVVAVVADRFGVTERAGLRGLMQQLGAQINVVSGRSPTQQVRPRGLACVH